MSEPEAINIEAFELSNGLRFSGGKLTAKLQRLGIVYPAPYELSVGSITHADQAALYYAGMMEENGVNTGLPKNVKKAAAEHHKEIHTHRGHVNYNWDGVDYTANVKLPPLTKIPEGYDAVLWLPKPKFVLHDHGIYQPEVDEAEPFVTVLPPNGWAVPTKDGFRNPKTGWALATVQSREDAIKQIARFLEGYMNSKKAIDVAEKEASYSSRRQKGEGKSVVYRDFEIIPSVGGPFDENALWGAGTDRDYDSFLLR